ncbi:MAG: sugar kinase [Betaproteobacteria bacterium AqS2]|uniref:Sugar kinase n=1 Tax=Candidatus Amphirhobacter heronislandensis TaxID=1732024 RepID=A0A930XWQ6_9GAMM|nr:sugar kinase [Betaproteobacteria bacterium AqS2]
MSKDASPALVCLGEPLAELNQQPDGRYLQGFGGDVSNCAVAAARQGAPTAFITCLGTDAFAAGIRRLWEEEGIDAGGVRTIEGAPTGLYFVTHDPQRGHAFSYWRRASASSRLAPEHLDRELIAGCRYLHLSGISQAISASARAAADAAIAIAKEHGALVSYDPNLRLALWEGGLDEARAVFEATAARCDLLLPSVEEMRQLTGLTDGTAIVERCLELGPATVCLSQGADGALLGTANGVKHSPAPAIPAVVDATAAGDTFDGALLARLIDAAYANRAAALATQSYGAASSIPDRAQIEDFSLLA